MLRNDRTDIIASKTFEYLSCMMIAGDINQLLVKDLQNNLLQLVSKPTRGKRTIDVFITNCPHLWKSFMIFHRLVRSDHKGIVVNPQSLAKPEGNMYVLAMFVNTER